MKKALILLALTWIGIATSSVTAKNQAAASLSQAEKILGDTRIVPAEMVIEAWKKIGIDIPMFSDTTLPSLELMKKAAELNLEGYNIFLIPIFDFKVSDLKKFYSNLSLYNTVHSSTGYQLVNLPISGKKDVADINPLPKGAKILESMVLYQSFATLYLTGYFQPEEIVLMPISENEFSIFSSDGGAKLKTKIFCSVVMRNKKAEIIITNFPKKFTCNVISNKRISCYNKKNETNTFNALGHLNLTLIPEEEEFGVESAFSF